MVKVTIHRNFQGQICRFVGSGHAAFDVHGKDIVCAAVSAILQTAAIGLETYLNIPVQIEMASGRFVCTLPDEIEPRNREAASAILETMRLGLVQLQEQYPEFVKLVDSAVDD